MTPSERSWVSAVEKDGAASALSRLLAAFKPHTTGNTEAAQIYAEFHRVRCRMWEFLAARDALPF